MAEPDESSEPQSRDWLDRMTPEEWIRFGLAEVKRAEAAYTARDARGAQAHLIRAAGMALNGALAVRFVPAWGRSYADHLRALGKDNEVPLQVRESADLLLAQNGSSGSVISLRTPNMEQRGLEAARTVMAHAYAVVHGSQRVTREGGT